MLFLAGPRQVGKTTTSLEGAPGNRYFNWDRQEDRMLITAGGEKIAKELKLHELKKEPVQIIFDEIHKYSKWKNFLKGFFDTHQHQTKIIITGSARLDIYKRGGDSLMGRYFLYRMHPLSLAELRLQGNQLRNTEIRKPKKVTQRDLEQLLTFGGFPEPFTRSSTRFYNRWKNLRLEQLFHEDLRELTAVQDIGQIRVLAEILLNLSGQLINYSTLASRVNISVDTVKRWIAVLESIYYCFSIRPWFKNVNKSLKKQPKTYLWDWSLVKDAGSKTENFIACSLLKAVHFWTDMGLGSYDLFYLRDTGKREVDFLVTKNDEPWFLVEAKTSHQVSLNPSLSFFQNQTKAKHAFQVDLSSPFVDQDCFAHTEPIKVPGTTFLSQLV
jgi:predicted AAA+ superfamily ATPase